MNALPTLSRRRLVATGLSAAAAVASSAVVLPAWAQNTAPRVLRVGHQKGWLSLLKARGTLEKRLAPLGASVSWVEFNAGPVQLEALNVGSIDYGDVGEAPPIFAQAAGARLAYAAATVPRPAVEAVVVPAQSAIRSVADLKGKRVAFNKGSNVHFFLVKLLEKHGLKYADVQPVFLAPPDARAAFERGSIDAWVIWDPFLASAEKSLGARVLVDATGVVNNRAYYFTSSDFAQKQPDLLKIAVEETTRIDRWIGDNKDAAAAELAQVLGLDRSVTAHFIQRVGYGTVPVTPDILAEQQAIADTFFELKVIPRKLTIPASSAIALA
ncbi:MAG: aliphatic sulfonate ABC transporter substrate-binding protein [Comamonas sp.]